MPTKKGEIELRVRRSITTQEGKLLEYVLNHPSGSNGTTIGVQALAAFWMPFALEAEGVSGQELINAVLTSIAQLEKQINLIKQVLTVNLHSRNNAIHPITSVENTLNSESPAIPCLEMTTSFDSPVLEAEVSQKYDLDKQEEEEDLDEETLRLLEETGWNQV
jgi:hypothetical protein